MIKRVNSSFKGKRPKWQGYFRLGKHGEIALHNSSMFSFDDTIFLTDVRASATMNNPLFF